MLRLSPMWRLATSSLLGLFLALLALPLAAHAITVSPVRLELNGDRGTVVHGEFKIFNEQKEPQTFYTNSENFQAQGETGNPSFTGGSTGLASWITAPSQVTVPAGQVQVVPFSIAIPAGAEAGGHFAAIFLGTQPNGGSGSGQIQVSISGKVGILILLRVNGEVKEGGDLLEFGIKDDVHFFTSLPVSFYYRFQNSGNDRIKPVGVLAIKNLIGLTSANVDANQGTGNVLPGSIRRFDFDWDKAEEGVVNPAPEASSGFFGAVSHQWRHFAFGRYSANLDLTYGADQKTVSASTSFWVLPWQLLLVILLIVVVGGSILLSTVRYYNRWIIKRATLANRQ